MRRNNVHNFLGAFYILGIFWGVRIMEKPFYDKAFDYFDMKLKLSFLGAAPFAVIILLLLWWLKVDSRKIYYTTYHAVSVISIAWILIALLDADTQPFWANVVFFVARIVPVFYYLLLFGTPIGIFWGVIIYAVYLVKWKGRDFLKAPSDIFVSYLGTIILRFVLCIFWFITWFHSFRFVIFLRGLGEMVD